MVYVHETKGETNLFDFYATDVNYLTEKGF